MHILCMATKTISLRLEAYERLKRVRGPGESFSDVVMRARWPEEAMTASEYLAWVRERGPLYTPEALDRVDELGADDAPPVDKW